MHVPASFKMFRACDLDVFSELYVTISRIGRTKLSLAVNKWQVYADNFRLRAIAASCYFTALKN
jgi:hypothetical protein